MSACPECRILRTSVVMTVQLENGWTRRRRACNHGCGHRWYTIELDENALDVQQPEDEKNPATGAGQVES